MVKRYWHGLDKEINALGFGCWQIAGSHNVNGKPNGWGNVPENETVSLLETAIQEGIEFFDTAQGYNNGKSEQLLGQAIKRSGSKDVTICTKVVLEEDEIANEVLGADFIKRVEQSLQNLQTGTIDVLLLHNPPDDILWSEFDFEVLEKLQQQGKIKTYGVSSRSIKGAVNAARCEFGSTVEWVFNIFERRPAEILFPLLEEKKMNFIARSPLSRGLINPKYLSQEPNFEKSDFRSTLPEGWVDWTIDSLNRFCKNGAEESTIIKEALKFCVYNSSVNSTIVGIKTQKQLNDLLKLSNELTNEESFNFDLLTGIQECYPAWK